MLAVGSDRHTRAEIYKTNDNIWESIDRYPVTGYISQHSIVYKVFDAEHRQQLDRNLTGISIIREELDQNGRHNKTFLNLSELLLLQSHLVLLEEVDCDEMKNFLSFDVCGNLELMFHSELSRNNLEILLLLILWQVYQQVRMNCHPEVFEAKYGIFP